MERRRAGFSRVDLVATIVSVVVLGCGLVVPGVSRQRQGARVTQCQHNLLAIGKASAAWAFSNRDSLPTFRGRAARPATLMFTPNSASSPTSDLEAVQDEAADALRQMTGRSDLVVSREWLPQVRYNWLVLWRDGFIKNAAMTVCPDDDGLGRRRREFPVEHQVQRVAWLAKFQEHPVDKTPAAYASSYEYVPACWSSPSSSATVEQGKTESEYRVPKSSPFGRGLPSIHDGAFSDRKVFIYEPRDWHFSSGRRCFADPDAREPLLFFDDASRVRTTRSANAGYQPNDRGSGPTTFTDRAAGLERAGDVLKGYYRWTRGGLSGTDFDGPEETLWDRLQVKQSAPDAEWVTATPWPATR
jgi:hypothetical protein